MLLQSLYFDLLLDYFLACQGFPNDVIDGSALTTERTIDALEIAVGSRLTGSRW